MRFILLLLASCLLFSLSSFSLVPIKKKPRLTQQEQRLQKKEKRLLQRFQKSTNLHQKARLQKRLRKVKHQQTSNSTHPLGIRAFIFGLIGLIALHFLALATIFVVVPYSTLQARTIYVIVLLATVILGALGLISSISFLKKYKSFSEEYNRKGLAVAGLVLSIITLFFALLLFIASFNNVIGYI